VKALLTAAGRGTRLGALTENIPKPMLPIAGTPMIERIMTGIVQQTGIHEFVLITGYQAAILEAYFGNGSRWGWQLEYIRQDIPRGLADAVNLSRNSLFDAPFFMTYGDIMIDPVNYGAVLKGYEENALKDCKVSLGLNWVADPWAGAAVTVDDDYRVRNLLEKPPKGTSTTHWNNAGLFVFDPIIFNYTAQVTPSVRGELELPDAICAMINGGHFIQGVLLTGAWRDVGTPEDYAAINKEMSEI
jgi:UDP-N-acetylglucosamine diphosphorylase / glucose-1-phosphate thymidylyltransferase / UDP-N-acetylgalactosamine diphosphorylase / glucosamine-1-phosphate N-acetyltransferase / galactosamine-1-phosphate N-acetyltransferase